jgi:NAD(P)-dependent dehydrogenase (short-subunit alcohol dehydrogenase family)
MKAEVTSPWWRGADPGHRLMGKRAFVTGAGTAPGGDLLGIGEAIAVLFASQGARVAVADASGERAEATVRLITDAGAEGVAVVCDLSTPSFVPPLPRRSRCPAGRSQS